MLAEDFETSCHSYENFQILAIDCMETFFSASDALAEVFEHLYAMPLASFSERRAEIEQTEMEIMRNILDHIGDKHFFIFTYHCDNHAVLVQLQEHGVMSFGMDINDIRKDHVYICVMDRVGGALN